MEVINQKSIKPLYLQIRERLMYEAEKNSDYKFPSERELCRLYNVSRPTIQKALSYFIENDLIVRRPGIGTMLRKDKSLSIEPITSVKVIVRKDWHDWKKDSVYFAKIMAGIFSCIRENERQLTVQQYSDNVKYLLLRSPDMCSMWLSPGDEELETIKTLAQNGHKVILINRETDYPNTSYVTTDHEYGAKLAVEYLLEKGHRNILFIESKRDSQIKELRYQGYISAFKSTGKFSNLAPLDIDKDQYVNELETKLPEILSSGNPPSAIFLANGHYQEPVMKILKNNNIAVPDDISLISFDDMENISERYGITVIQQKLLDIGHQAFNAINGGVLKEKIKPRILLRSSVRRLNVPKDN